MWLSAICWSVWTNTRSSPTASTRRSCETQLFTLVYSLASAMDKGIQTDMVILDFSKAFDRVSHQRLLRKLHHYGIRGHLHIWISSFLIGRTHSVIVEGVFSVSAPVAIRVPRVQFRDPYFLLFINDLPDNITSKTRLLADYCIVYRTVRSQEDCMTLQRDPCALADWERKRDMEFHPQKCNVFYASLDLDHPSSILTHSRDTSLNFRIAPSIWEWTCNLHYHGKHIDWIV